MLSSHLIELMRMSIYLVINNKKREHSMNAPFLQKVWARLVELSFQLDTKGARLVHKSS